MQVLRMREKRRERNNNMIYQNITFPNGIRIIHKNSDSLVSHLGIIINAGSRDETETEQGIAHFIEHTIFKGTKKRRSYQVLSHMENVGGEINAFTTKEETCIYTSFMNKFLERAADLIADITFNSIFPEKELEKEKEVVLDEINSYRDNPAEEIFDEFEKLVFARHSIGKYILGEPSCIKKFKKHHLLHFIKRCYNTNEIVICSVGNINFSLLVKILEKYFSKFSSNKRNWKRKKFKGYKPFYTEVKKPIHQSHCIIGNTAYHSKDRKRSALIMLNNILGGPGMNSKLSMNIREKYGFCYNIESNYTSFSDAGIFSIYFGTDQENIEKTTSLVLKELEKLRTTKLGTLQLQRAKLQLIGQLAISYESGMNEMLSIGKSFLVFDKVDTIEQINSKIEAVTAEQLIETANEIFDTNSLSTLIFKSEQ
jgi:predicted Zn-dependent peptidase